MPIAGLVISFCLIVGSLYSLTLKPPTGTPEAQRILTDFRTADRILKASQMSGNDTGYQDTLDRATLAFGKHACGAESPRVVWTAKEREQVVNAQRDVLQHQKELLGPSAKNTTFGGASTAAAYSCKPGSKPVSDNKPEETNAKNRQMQAGLALADLLLALAILGWMARYYKAEA